MNRMRSSFAILTLLICTTGCWDQENLKDARLANATAYDLTPNGKIKQTLEIVNDFDNNQESGANEVHSGIGRSIRQSTDQIRSKVSGDIRYYKYGVILYGKELTVRDIYPYMDVLYREPDYPTSHVKIAIVDGEAGELLQEGKVGNLLVGEFLSKKIRSLEELCMFPDMTLETLLPPMLDPGQDFVLPYLTKQDKDIVAQGIALFSGQKFTGTLSREQSSLYVIMSGKWKKTARFVKKVNPGPVDDPENYIAYEAVTRSIKRKLVVKVFRDGQIDVYLRIKLPITVVEYAANHLHKKETQQRLNRELTDQMTEDAERIIQQLQDSKCDAFGIGRQLIAHHPALWKELDWDKDYAEVRFHPQVQVTIVGSGVLN